MQETNNRSFESEGFRAHIFLSEEQRRQRRWDYVASKLTTVLAEENTAWKRARTAHNIGHHIQAEQLTFEFDVAGLFRSLAAWWSEDSKHMSNINKAIAHPAYQQIIGMGKVLKAEIVPLLLTELTERPDHWFRALVEIAGIDAAEGEETFEGAVRCWLDWGRRKGYLIHARPAA